MPSPLPFSIDFLSGGWCVKRSDLGTMRHSTLPLYLSYCKIPTPSSILMFLLVGRRTLRSGKEFSAYDLSFGSALEPTEYFDVETCLELHIADQEASGMFDEIHDGGCIDVPAFCLNLPAPEEPTPQLSTSPPSASRRSALKEASKRRRNNQRAAAGPSAAKTAAIKHRQAALKTPIRVNIDTAALPHSKPAWIGDRNTEDEHEDGMGGKIYTREEIHALTGATDLRYINWMGK
ncbi:hypothetical protein C8R43DRAFT_1117365 [Mycena crocata]|nr:hypothetical protein C8R43DRAFT_1117365 [Mycena crocata]